MKPTICLVAPGCRGYIPAVPGELMKAILFVDDHEVLARLSCEILEMQGYRAVSAYSANDALEKFERDKFDLMVTDFRMEGMNGLELARKVHDKYPGVPVIIVTGYGPIDGGRDVDTVLSKEALFPDLLDKIKYYLKESEPAEEVVELRERA
jgi:CheY-like chemotaxis protein